MQCQQYELHFIENELRYTKLYGSTERLDAMQKQGDLFGAVGETEANPTLLLHDNDDVFLKQSATIPMGVLSVNVFGCQNLILDGDSLPDNYKLYGKVSVGSLGKSTSVTMQTKKGKLVWNEVLNFPITIVSQMKDLSNQVAFSVLGYDSENSSKHRLIGKVAFHVHKLVKIGWSMDKYELNNRKKQKVGFAELEFAFSYGLFGYGFSDQLENIVHSPEEVLRQSMFPHVQSPEDNKFSKWSVLKPKTVAHPTYIPFSDVVTDLKPDLFADDEETLIFVIPEKRQSLKDALPRLSKHRKEYLEQIGRTQRIKFLKKLIHAKEPQGVEEDSESSEEESGNFIPAGLAGMLSGVARATITQTIPGVTVRNRADYGNLKVAISLESVTDDNISPPPSNADVNVPSISVNSDPIQTLPKQLIAMKGSISPRQAQLADRVPVIRVTTPSPSSSEEEDVETQASGRRNVSSYIHRFREKLKELNQGSSNEEDK